MVTVAAVRDLRAPDGRLIRAGEQVQVDQDTAWHMVGVGVAELVGARPPGWTGPATTRRSG